MCRSNRSGKAGVDEGADAEAADPPAPAVPAFKVTFSRVPDGLMSAPTRSMCRAALSVRFTAGGAAVTYREIDDLSHTYPREMNAEILQWLGST